MEGKVKIAEIDIGVDKLIKSAGEAKQRIAEIAQEQKLLKKSTGDLRNASEEQLKQFTKNDVEAKSLAKTYRNNTKVIDAYVNIQNEDIRTKEQARDANIKLIAIANKLDVTNEDQAKLLKKVNAEIDQNTDFIKENASEYERTKINIGNYKEAVTEALGELNIFGKYQSDVNAITKSGGPIISFLSTNLKQVREDYKKAASETYGMSKAQVAAHLTSTALAGGLKILKIALAATGIGLVVIALGSLITYFASTQEGINKVNMVLTPLKEAFNAVTGSVQELGAAFAKLFTGDIKGFLSDIKDIGAEMKTNIKEAVERGKEMETIQQNLNKSEADYITLQAKLNKEFEQQKKLSDDTTKTTEQRTAAAEKAIKLQSQISEGSIKRIKQEAEIIRLKQMSNDTSDAERAILATKLAEIDKALQEEASKTKEAQNKVNSIRKQGADQRKAEHQAALQMQSEALDAELEANQVSIALYKEKQGFAARTGAEQLATAQKVYEKELEIEQKKLKAGKISAQELYLFKLQKQNELGKMQAEIAIDIAQRELEAFKSGHERKIEAGEFLNEQLFSQEQERLNKIFEAEQEFQEKRLEQGIINQQQYNDAIAAVNQDNYQQQEELRKEREAAKKDQQAFEIALQREMDDQRFESLFELERAREQRRYETELAEAERLGVGMELVEQKHANAVEQINQKKEDARVAMYAESLGAVAQLLGEQTEAGKVFALTQALINTYQGITAALTLPFPANILASVKTGAVGFQAVKDITKTKVPKAERGLVMDINGKPHSQGGETFFDAMGNPVVEAQGGEKMVILNRAASAELSALSALNQKHGGNSLSTHVTYANNGGAIMRRGGPLSMPKNMGIDYEKLSGMFSDAIATKINDIKMGIPVNSLNELNQQNTIIERGANS